MPQVIKLPSSIPFIDENGSQNAFNLDEQNRFLTYVDGDHYGPPADSLKFTDGTQLVRTLQIAMGGALTGGLFLVDGNSCQSFVCLGPNGTRQKIIATSTSDQNGQVWWVSITPFIWTIKYQGPPPYTQGAIPFIDKNGAANGFWIDNQGQFLDYADGTPGNERFNPPQAQLQYAWPDAATIQSVRFDVNSGLFDFDGVLRHSFLALSWERLPMTISVTEDSNDPYLRTVATDGKIPVAPVPPPPPPPPPLPPPPPPPPAPPPPSPVKVGPNCYNYGTLRYNEATSRHAHNAYAMKPSYAELLNFGPNSNDYGFRSLEIDLWPITNEYQIGHSVGDSHETFGDFLYDLRAWHQANPGHDVVTIFVEMKSQLFTYDGVNAYIRRYFTDRVDLFRPVDLLTDPNKKITLTQAILDRGGWPYLNELRGKLLFVLNGCRAVAWSRDYDYRNEVFFFMEGASRTDPNRIFKNLDAGKDSTLVAKIQYPQIARCYYTDKGQGRFETWDAMGKINFLGQDSLDKRRWTVMPYLKLGGGS